MIKTAKIALTILIFVAMVFSACNLDWDGEITVTGGTKLPYWIGWISRQDSPIIDGVEKIEVNPPRSAYYIFRVGTYNGLVDILTVQCNCAEPCNHDYIKEEIDENEVKKLLGKFNQNFFETKNLIVTGIAGSPITMNFHVNNIDKNGVINVTETKKLVILPVNDVLVEASFAIAIDSSFITPASMGVKIK